MAIDTLKKQKDDWDDPVKAAQKIAKKVAKLEKKIVKEENQLAIDQYNEQIAEIIAPGYADKTKTNVQTAIDDLTAYIGTLSDQQVIDDILTYIG